MDNPDNDVPYASGSNQATDPDGPDYSKGYQGKVVYPQPTIRIPTHPRLVCLCGSEFFVIVEGLKSSGALIDLREHGARGMHVGCVRCGSVWHQEPTRQTYDDAVWTCVQDAQIRVDLGTINNGVDTRRR